MQARKKRAEKDGGADRNRTCDLLNAIQTLCQLSYDPNQCRQCKDRGQIVKANSAAILWRGVTGHVK